MQVSPHDAASFTGTVSLRPLGGLSAPRFFSVTKNGRARPGPDRDATTSLRDAPVRLVRVRFGESERAGRNVAGRAQRAAERFSVQMFEVMIWRKPVTEKAIPDQYPFSFRCGVTAHSATAMISTNREIHHNRRQSVSIFDRIRNSDR